jgi:hypothetical protein
MASGLRLLIDADCVNAFSVLLLDSDTKTDGSTVVFFLL